MAATVAPIPKTLIPATPIARRRGCSCPVVRNGFGDGCAWDAQPGPGQRVESVAGHLYLIADDCEVHGTGKGEPQ